MNKVILNKPIALLLAAATCLLMILPLRTLLAEVQSGRVGYLLDDPATGGRDVVDVSEETLPAYEQAARALRAAIALDPGKSRNHKALAELDVKRGLWAETMEGMQGHASRSSKEDFRQAIEGVRASVALEPTNPDYHLALGSLYDITGKDAEYSGREYTLAVNSYPVNSPLRYAVAMRYLLTGRNTKALEQASELARTDETYKMGDSVREKLIMQRSTPQYQAWLSNSYLYKSFEIAWRAADRQMDKVREIAPQDDQAREVLRLFQETKGIEQR